MLGEAWVVSYFTPSKEGSRKDQVKSDKFQKKFWKWQIKTNRILNHTHKKED